MRGSVPPKKVLARPKSLQTTSTVSGHLWASKRATVDHCSMTDGYIFNIFIFIFIAFLNFVFKLVRLFFAFYCH